MSRPILVTGSHRSGTTWVGRMLSLAPDVTYIHEPFNVEGGFPLPGAPVRHWYQFVTEANESSFYDPVRRAMNLQYPLAHQWRHATSYRERLGHIKACLRFMQYRWQHHTPLVKDPLAFFAAPWMHRRFGARVVVMVRHPAAFVGSLKAKDWTHPFGDFARQPLLMERHLAPYADQIRAFTTQEHDIIDQAVLLWNIIYSVALDYRDRYSDDWLFIRHEDLAQAPLKGFERLYTTLSIDYTSRVQDAIQAHSTVGKAQPAPESEASVVSRGHSVVRDSQAVVRNWTSRLTPEEIERVYAATGPVARHFYDEEEWYTPC